MPPKQAPNCLACRHFIVTWDPDWPRGCGVFGIKSRNLPSLEVFAATGTHCPAFEPVEARAVRQRESSGGNSPAPSEDEGGIWA